MKTYNPKTEHKEDINKPEIQAKIAEAKGLYQNFLNQYGKGLDLQNPESIKETYHKAKGIGILEKAKEIRNLIFGKDMHFYGVSYLWDACMNHCAYCPGSVPNRKKAIESGNEYPLRELSVNQAVADTISVMKDGHTHVCYLSGSSPGRERLPNKMVPYLNSFDKLGLEEIILNIEPATEAGFRIMKEAVKETPLQFRVFQETYNKETYAKMHPKGPKADYNFRRQSQARAINAGFDNIGLGALFGLHRYPLEEIEGLREHAEELEREYGKKPARVCLPSANELTNIGVQIPYFLKRGIYTPERTELKEAGDYEKFNELVYALAKLAMPTLSIVSSERDRPAMLKILDNYTTCTTLNVHPGVGDNANIFSCNGNKQTHFEQATTFPRDPKETITNLRSRGYNPIIDETRLK
jgi:2-iminoacetate synthase ThiH